MYAYVYTTLKHMRSIWRIQVYTPYFSSAPLHTEEEAVRPAVGQPTIFSGFVCFEWLRVDFCANLLLAWRVCACIKNGFSKTQPPQQPAFQKHTCTYT